tara:strand:+ start:2304 stop:3254 length:951 start_codon:yes stop_codon:yes gene_type:complete
VININLSQPILLTGSTGFIGSNLLRYLINNKINVSIIIRKKSNLDRISDLIDSKFLNIFYADLTEKRKIYKIIKKIKPKTIFHLATYGAYSFQSKRDLIKKNIIEGSLNLLDSCVEEGFDSFINTGSNSEYGFKDKAMSEKDLLEPNSYYSNFKATITNYCSFIAKKNKLNIVTVRPFHVYGPFEDNRRLIPNLINSLLIDKDIKMVSPKISRDLIYIDDVIELYLIIATSKVAFGKIYNMGTGIQTNMLEIFSIAKKLCNSNSNALWNQMQQRQWDQDIWLADMSLVKKELGWTYSHSFEQGIAKTIDWYRNVQS